jgi:hypothetical protein
MVDSLIGDVQALKKKPKYDEGLTLLKTIISHVTPIMKARSYRVGKVSEFYPGNKNLLGININGGQEIRIRLRDSWDETRFLPFEMLIGT